MSKPRTKLRPEDLVAIIDTREKTPWSLKPLRSQCACLPTGDYSIRGLETAVCVERKSLPDLLGCIGRDRRRFEGELHRMRGYESRAVIVEASWTDLVQGRENTGAAWRSQITPAAACGSVLGWMGTGIPFLFCGDASAADLACARFLFLAAKHRWETLQSLSGGVAV